MLEWSDVDIAVRDAVREFVDKEIRPNIDALESGEMEPYPIVRKLFSDVRHRRDGARSRWSAGCPGCATAPHPRQVSPRAGCSAAAPIRPAMGFVLISELCRVSMGIVTGMGVSLGLTVPTIQSRGTLAQQERWLPGLVTLREDRRLGHHRAGFRFGCVRAA